MRGCTSIGRIVGDRIAMSFHVCGLGCSNAGDREDTGSDLVTSCLAGAAEVIGLTLFVGIDAVVRFTPGIGLKTLESVGQKLRQSS